MADPIVTDMTQALTVMLGGGGGLTGLFLLGRFIYRRILRDSAETAKDRAESTLYTQLKEEVQGMRERTDQAFKERNDLILRVGELQGQVNELERVREQNTRLIAKLEDKDIVIQQRDARIEQMLMESVTERARWLSEITRRDGIIEDQAKELRELRQRIHDLEIRLSADEKRMAGRARRTPEVPEVKQ